MKTKAILSSLLVCIVTTLSAQINLNDSTVQVVAYWSKGDSYDYLYDYYKYNIQGKDTISWERTTGQSICYEPYLYHTFWAEDDHCLVGEVSTVNDDMRDNRFLTPKGRFPQIEEDVPAEHLLCNEYPEV